MQAEEAIRLAERYDDHSPFLYYLKFKVAMLKSDEKQGVCIESIGANFAYFKMSLTIMHKFIAVQMLELMHRLEKLVYFTIH